MGWEHPQVNLLQGKKKLFPLSAQVFSVFPPLGADWHMAGQQMLITASVRAAQHTNPALQRFSLQRMVLHELASPCFAQTHLSRTALPQ